jgi:putative transposase
VNHCLSALPNISRQTICNSLGCNRTHSYYQSRKQESDRAWLTRITTVLKNHPDYGIYRLHLYFQLQSITISQAKLRRICRSSGILATPKRSRPPGRDSKLPHSKIPNLIAGLIQDKLILAPDHVWSGDFSYFKIQGIWHYLATVIDTYTKEILGVSLSPKHDTNLITRAITMALKKNRKPNIFHSDQGSEYTSVPYRQLLENNHIKQSNSQKSSPWQNGYQESFYGKFKQELRLYRLNSCNSYLEAYSLILRQIEYYNNYRIHTTIKNIPHLFYQQYLRENNVSEEVVG